MSTINLKFFRNSFNLTQKKLANHLSVEEQTIKYYESGHTIPSFKILIKIQTLFQISFDFFIFNEKCYYPKNLKLLKLAKKLDNFYKSEARNNIEASTKNLLGKKINAPCKTRQDTIDIDLIGNFNLNLKNIRIHKNVTQLEIGKAINSARSTVSLYEKNSYPKLKKMIKLSKFFDVSIHAMVTGEKLRFDFQDGHFGRTIVLADQLLSLDDHKILIKLMENIILESTT